MRIVWHALSRTQFETTTSSHTATSPSFSRIARRMRQSSPVLNVEFPTRTWRHASKSIPSELITRWSLSILIPSTDTFSHRRMSIVHPAESLNVTPWSRTSRQRTNCTSRGRGRTGLGQKPRNDGLSLRPGKNSGPRPSTVPSPVIAMSSSSHA